MSDNEQCECRYWCTNDILEMDKTGHHENCPKRAFKKQMTVKEIIEKYLKDNGYDGLYNENGECACKRDDLMPCRHYCGDGQESCCVGYLQPVTDANIEFMIGKK